MKNKKTPIDCFVNIIDNFGDMGFVAEFCLYYQKSYPDFFFTIFTNEKEILENFFAKNNFSNVEICDMKNFRANAENAISFLHSDFPKNIYKKVVRIDYISFDKNWLKQNGAEHIHSTKNHQIIECIPSVFSSGSGILPKVQSAITRDNLREKYNIFQTNNKNFSIFCYEDTLQKIDLTNIPDNLELILFGVKNPENFLQNPRIHILPLVSIEEMYAIFENSDYLLTRGEISFMQALQGEKPFLWDLYHAIGGFPADQSNDFLDFIEACPDYRQISHKLWHENEKISISEMTALLENSQKNWKKQIYKNIADETKKILDKNENSI